MNIADYCDMLVIVYFRALYLLLCLCRCVFCGFKSAATELYSSLTGARYVGQCR
jgi:hypothetical protein